MNKARKNPGQQKNDRMLNEKTNEDFNQQKPKPESLKQNKEHQVGEDDQELEKQREETPKMDSNTSSFKTT